jgi:hypothetical protein
MRRVLILTPLLGCAHAPEALRPTDVIATVAAGLHFGSQIAAWRGSEALAIGDRAGCIAGGVAASLAQSAAVAVAAGPSKTPVLPNVQINISACGVTEPILEGADASVAPVLSLTFESARTLLTIHGSRLPCREHAWIDGALAWGASAAPAIYEELRAPDGVVSVPEVTVDLSACGGAE